VFGARQSVRSGGQCPPDGSGRRLVSGGVRTEQVKSKGVGLVRPVLLGLGSLRVAVLVVAVLGVCAGNGWCEEPAGAPVETPSGAVVGGSIPEGPKSTSEPVVVDPPAVKPVARNPLQKFRQLSAYDGMGATERGALVALELFTYFWFVAVGAVVGSFLNVVIYRWPLGLSISHPPSRCSSCMEPIRIQDNIPIISWLRLRGRCRFCQATISSRYPLIEATIAVLFGLIAACEFISGGRNLPVRPANTYAGAVWTVWYLKSDLLGLYLYHTTLLTGLVAAAMTIWDRHRLPIKLVGFLAAAGLVAGLAFESLHPVPWRPLLLTSRGGLDGTWIQHPFLTVMLGTLGGVVFGGMFWAVALRDRRTAVDQMLIWALVGLFLGWQAALSGLCLAAVLALIGAVWTRFAGCCTLDRGSGLISAIAATVQLLAWEPLTHIGWLPGPQSAFVATPYWLAALGLSAGLIRGTCRAAAEESSVVPAPVE
jgi:prepilin signal peptidase PulO-like enzyme (type II secretory pathway)